MWQSLREFTLRLVGQWISAIGLVSLILSVSTAVLQSRVHGQVANVVIVVALPILVAIGILCLFFAAFQVFLEEKRKTKATVSFEIYAGTPAVSYLSNGMVDVQATVLFQVANHGLTEVEVYDPQLTWEKDRWWWRPARKPLPQITKLNAQVGAPGTHVLDPREVAMTHRWFALRIEPGYLSGRQAIMFRGSWPTQRGEWPPRKSVFRLTARVVGAPDAITEIPYHGRNLVPSLGVHPIEES
jgi:hypothetical protein